MLAWVRGLAAVAVVCVAFTSARATEPVNQGNDTIKVFVDQARLLKLPEGTSTLVVGNPLIADVAVQGGGTMVVTGKGYGTTNLIALDRNGGIIIEHMLEVQGPKGPTVVLYRGIERETYSCTPTCERRITLGDTQNYFAATLGQSGAVNMQAQAGQQPR